MFSQDLGHESSRSYQDMMGEISVVIEPLVQGLPLFAMQSSNLDTYRITADISMRETTLITFRDFPMDKEKQNSLRFPLFGMYAKISTNDKRHDILVLLAVEKFLCSDMSCALDT